MPGDTTLRVPVKDSELLRMTAVGRPVAVDRKANVLRGYVVAQLGPFKSDGRGEFDQHGLDQLLQLGQQATQGVKSRFSHPTECSDGLGKYLGRSRDFFMGETKNAAGQTVAAVRADLHFDPTAMDTPPQGGKALGVYVMDLAESDPDALSSSAVIRVKKEYRRKPDGTMAVGDDGKELPPLWRPQKLWASDVVDTGDAVDGLLSADDSTLPNAHLWKGAEILDGMFDGLSRDEVKENTIGWLARYLELRFGPEEKPLAMPPVDPAPVDPPPAETAGPSLSTLRRRQRLQEYAAMG